MDDEYVRDDMDILKSIKIEPMFYHNYSHSNDRIKVIVLVKNIAYKKELYANYEYKKYKKRLMLPLDVMIVDVPL